MPYLAQPGQHTMGQVELRRSVDDYAESVKQLQEVCASVLETNQKLVKLLESRQLGTAGPQFNLQYLQLQQKMQADNRQFTMLSNILKNKHDTAKNSINNIR